MRGDLEDKRLQILALCRQYHVRRLALFGSALRDDFDAERSDLDFVVEFEPLPAGVYADAYFGLSEALEQLFRRRVDLIEAGAVRNPFIQQEIETSQVTIYAA